MADPAANEALIDRFYAAFAAHDGDAMAACYTPDAVFEDPAFGELRDGEPQAMWRMLTGRAQDLTVKLVDRSAGASTGDAHWVADYTFSTGRKVHNDVRARFTFAEDGLIADHRDSFDLKVWAKQALGPTGAVLGFTPLLKPTVRRKARGGLEEFMAGPSSAA